MGLTLIRSMLDYLASCGPASDRPLLYWGGDRIGRGTARCSDFFDLGVVPRTKEKILGTGPPVGIGKQACSNYKLRANRNNVHFPRRPVCDIGGEPIRHEGQPVGRSSQIDGRIDALLRRCVNDQRTATC
jgi:hypothetical protein